MMYAQENEGFIALERCLYAEGWSWAHETAVPTYPSITDTNKSLDKSYQCPAAKSHELSVYRVYGAFKYSLGSTFEKNHGSPLCWSTHSGNVTSTAVNIERATQPVEYPLLSDSACISTGYQHYFMNTDSTSQPSGIHFVHGGRANLLWSDGHADSQSWRKLKAQFVSKGATSQANKDAFYIGPSGTTTCAAAGVN